MVEGWSKAREQTKRKQMSKCHQKCQIDEPNNVSTYRFETQERCASPSRCGDHIYAPSQRGEGYIYGRGLALFPRCRLRHGHYLPRPCSILTSSTPSVRRALQARPQLPSTEWVNESNSTPPLPSRQCLAPSTNEYVQNKRRGRSALTPKTGERYGGRDGGMGRTMNVS